MDARACLTCSKTFTPTHRSGQYCSKACSGVSRRRKPVELTCQECGKLFVVSRPPSVLPKLCSVRCAARRASRAALASVKPRREFPADCATCGRSFVAYTTPRKFCSRRCQLQDVHEARRSIGERPCEVCGTPFQPRQHAAAGRFCSRSCMALGTRGENAPHFRGGRLQTDQGYVRILHEGDYVPEHRLVMERQLGRPLEPHETVHHINGVRDDNRPENLQLRSGKHGKGVVRVCLDCGSHNVSEVAIAG